MLISKYRTDNMDTEAAVASFEDKNNIRLPEVYRRFMIRYNGGDTPDTDFRLNR